MRYNPKRHRLPVCNAFGILLVDKPTDWTSFDVVNFVRGRFNFPKVGHCGTLDPAATGLLVLTVGKFTSYSNRFAGDDKTYEATLKLGITTDSYDMEGEITSECDASAVEDAQVAEVIAGFKGSQKQLPPMVSAVKVGGKKLYELARKGIEIEREYRDIEISKIDITRMANPEYDFTVKCSKGTYIRTLCADIGARLGCGGCMKTLQRASASGFSLADAHTLTELENMTESEREACVFPVEHIFMKYDEVKLPAFFAKLAHSGLEIYLKKINLDLPLGTLVRLSDKDGFFALGEVREYEDGLAIKPIRQFE